MLWQTINFSLVIEQVLATFFRKVRLLALFQSFVVPLQTLADKTLYQMQHDSRVIYLEKMLNEYFEIETYDSLSHIATRQIYIVDAPQPPQTYIYQPAENQPLYLGTVFLDREVEGNYDFIVKIPEAIVFDEPRLRAEIDYYKLAGKRYLIETY